MALVFRSQELAYSAESSFAEATNSLEARLPPLEPPRVELRQDRIPDPAIRSRMNEEGLSHIGPRSASIEFTTYWPGHLTATTGSLSQTWAQDLLSDGLGGGSTAQVGGTVNAPTSATQFSVTSATCVSGAIIRVGTKGDGRADGQAAVVNNASTVTLLTALPAAPNAADVVYASQMAYHDESASATLGTKRFLVSNVTTGAQFMLRGCQLAGLTFDLPIGGMPKITWRYEAAYWDRVADATPSARSVASHDCAPIAGGSLFIQAVGTTTRNTESPSTLNLALNLGLAPIQTTGGVGQYQYITGWQRTKCQPTLTMTVPWSTTYETWWDTSNATIVNKHILATLSSDNGCRSVSFYMPNCQPVGPRPSGVTESNSQNYVTLTVVGNENTSGSTELQKSAIRFAMG